MRPPAIVFCERLDNESFCAAIVRELERRYEVRPCGPGWPIEDLPGVDPRGARFYLELDAVTGSFVRPRGLAALRCPKFAWLVDTHKKTEHHRRIAREVDLTFVAHRTWGQVLEGPWTWLPLHADGELFRAVERERDLDLAFVGSQTWRAEALERIARRHGLRLLVTTTTGAREKSETAAIYARSRLVFNRHCANDLNFRVFEAMACGRVLLTDAQPNGQYELFQEDRHYALYKDELDLERQVLRLLGDDALRATIEREAATLAHAHHTTRARVAQLVQGIETAVGPVMEGLHPEARIVSAGEPGTGEQALPRGRWLVLAGDEPAAVRLESHAERLAGTLRELGQEAVLARVQRGRFPSRCVGLREIDLGPQPVPGSAAGRLLAAAIPLQARLGRLSLEEGPFDAVLAEGALGGLVGPPLAARVGVPLVLALPDCEVERRGNQLTREQLHLAELEHWGADRAARVIVPSPEVQAAVRARYGREAGWVPVPSLDLAAPARVHRLLERLGLPERPLVLLGEELGHRERQAAWDWLTTQGEPAVWVGQEVWSLLPGQPPRRLAGCSARGAALGALLAASSAAIVIDRCAERRADALALAPRAVAIDLGDLREARERLVSHRPVNAVRELETIARAVMSLRRAGERCA